MPRKSRKDRFWSKVRVPLEKEFCWVWTGTTIGRGYGLFWVGPSMKDFSVAHRFAYELLVGPIPEGLTLDHLCKNKSCVNPEHLEPVTNRENILRSDGVTAVHARQSHCKNGHPFSHENTYWRKDSYGRKCRICMKRQAEVTYAKRIQGGHL